jgi:hypothetical protein
VAHRRLPAQPDEHSGACQPVPRDGVSQRRVDHSPLGIGAAPQAHPAATSDLALHLVVRVARTHGVPRREHTELTVGDGAQGGMHAVESRRRRPLVAGLADICGRRRPTSPFRLLPHHRS